MKNFIPVIILLLLVACGVPQPQVESGTSPTSSRPLLTETPTFFPASTPTASPVPIDTISAGVSGQASLSPLPFEPGQPLSIANLHLFMKDEKSGWATLGHHLLHTSDSGVSWQEVAPPEREVFFFLDAQIAWATSESWCDWNGFCDDPYPHVTSATVWRTTDSGQTWLPSQPIGFEQEYYVPTLYFLDAKNGWLLTWLHPSQMGQVYQELLKTTDGGATWKIVSNSLPMMGGIASIGFSDTQNGWAEELGSHDNHNTHLWKTTDGGATWDPFQSPQVTNAPGNTEIIGETFVNALRTLFEVLVTLATVAYITLAWGARKKVPVKIYLGLLLNLAVLFLRQPL